MREYFEDFIHYTNAGAQQLAENYADFLIGYLEGQAHFSSPQEVK